MTDSKEKTLYLFTNEFPYGNSETYLESEIPVLVDQFDKVYLFPSIRKISGHKRLLPEKFEVVVLNTDWVKQRNKLLFKNFVFIAATLFNEYKFISNKRTFFKNFKMLKNKLLHRLYLSEQLEIVLLEKKVTNSIFCSYWFSDSVILLGILKKQGVINSFVSRAHGFDIYDNRNEDGYIPFRYFQLKMVDRVFSVSNKGKQYLKSKKAFPEKVETSYLGVADLGENPFNESEIYTIVSCSNVNIFKRIDLIVEILKHLSFPVNWIHFGDGDQLENIKEQSKALPDTIHVDFKGRVANSEVMDFYKNNTVHLFITTSAMEGLPMTLIEAASFGIPLMGTNVGGIPEIINDTTGLLIPEKVDVIAVAKLIDDFLISDKNSKQFRGKVKGFWKENFEAIKNYNDFYDRVQGVQKNN